MGRTKSRGVRAALTTMIVVASFSVPWSALTQTGPEKSARGVHSLQPMDAKVWFANYQRYRAASIAIADRKEPDRHFALGNLALEHGLEDEAWEQWLTALYLDPNHAGARAAIGYEWRDQRWFRPHRLNREWIDAVKAAGRAYRFTIAIEDDASEEFLREFSWRVRRLNWLIWDLTEGQAFLERIVIADRTGEGRIVVERGKLDTPLIEGGGARCENPGRADWRILSGGRCYVRILCHEFFHGIFALPDERHGCACIMQGGLYGVKTSDLLLCDAESHVHHPDTPVACWDLIRRRFPDMKHPNSVAYGDAPWVEIEIRDR